MIQSPPLAPPARLLFATLAWVLAAGSAPAAQSGPFASGELLLRGPSPASVQDTIYRIDPVTGVGAPLVSEVFPNYSTTGFVAFDPWRNRVLYYGSLVEFGVFEPRLFSIATDGSVQDLGLDNAEVSALAPSATAACTSTSMRSCPS